VGLLFALVRPAGAYSLLTHEQVVDVVWRDDIEPLLQQRFPGATRQELHEAHAFAYGGCLVQDLGYYPFGSVSFSDLTHYVRSGDFVSNLIAESTNRDELAFAMGALAHYCSDTIGHPYINRCVALSFPRLRAKYGDEVTYAEDKKAHIRVEFGFDMAEVAKNRYTSQQYHDFIGFEVAKPLLERAFQRTYGLSLEEVLGHTDLAIGTFRRAVSKFIPAATQAALLNEHPSVSEVRDRNQREFLYHLSRSEYEREWGKEYRRPNLFERFLAFVLRWIPKFGPLKTLDFKTPTPETEDLYFKSVNETVKKYHQLTRAIRADHDGFPDLDCDTGRPARLGEYVLADQTYGRLLDELAKSGLERVTPDLRKKILSFYADPSGPQRGERRREWEKTLRELNALTWMNVEAAPERGATPAREPIH
jgi:hypothetical protein